ncbi:MAG: cytochrome c oxidase subunit II [Solirubrobacteraceae bacterium]
MRRIALVGLVLSAIAVPLFVVFVGPLLPPGAASDAAHGQQQDNTVMVAIVIPIVIYLLLYFGYALRAFRDTGEGDAADGVPLRGSSAITVTWIAVTFVIVLFLATWGAYELIPGETGAGGGQGPTPLAAATPEGASKALVVQVIGQQWAWTYRYPSYGGLETTELVLPVNRLVRFNVTSIDVIHSYWANQLGVKADANPGVNNVAFVKPVELGSSTIRCAELCGLWHGHMISPLHVVSKEKFATWIADQERAYEPVHKYLPKYSLTYAPSPTYRPEEEAPEG